MSHRRLVGRGLASIGLLAVAAVAAAPASAVTKVVTEFKIKTANNQPGDMAVGTDGNVWFVDQNTSKVAQISKTGAITGYLTHTANSKPTGITLGPDGAMWFTEAAANKIGRISSPAGHRLPDPDGGIQPARDHAGHRRLPVLHGVQRAHDQQDRSSEPRRLPGRDPAGRQRSDAHRDRLRRQPVGDRDARKQGRQGHPGWRRHPGHAHGQLGSVAHRGRPRR